MMYPSDMSAYSPYGAMVPYGSEYSPYGAMAPQDMRTTTAMPYTTPQPVGALSGAAAAGRNAPAYNRRDHLPSINPNLDLATVGGQQGYNFVTNKGKVARTGANPSGFVAVDPNTEYRLVNLRGGERDNPIVTSGVGEAGLRDVYANSQLLSARDGKKAYWAVEQLNPTTGDWTRVADDPRGGMRGALTKYGDIVLPTIGAVLGGPLGAALGSAASGTLQGKSIGNIALNAALTGGMAYGGGQLMGAGSGLGGGIFGDAINSALPLGLGGNVAGGALNVAAATAPKIAGDVMYLTGQKLAPTVLGKAATAAASSAIGGGALSKLTPTNTQPKTTPNTDPSKIIVTGPQQNVLPNLPSFTFPVPPVLGGSSGALGATTSTNPADSKITVTGEQQPTLTPEQLAAVGIPTAVGAGLVAASGGQPTKPPSDPSTIEDIRTWLERANLAASVIGPLAGAIGGGGGGGNLSAGALASLGNLNPIFSSQLPASNLAARAPRDMSGTDWENYGMGPEQSFFTDVPQRLAEGGMAHSDGRSDDVPALLSRGEYVIDAETMALLGNGDPMAGADKMDQWRVNVRKHKGRQLMKGDISPDAKMPKEYMGGGRI